eukprot:COSAG02_NODE_1481_length_12389_cov_15.643857_4_plen_89_part_00
MAAWPRPTGHRSILAISIWALHARSGQAHRVLVHTSTTIVDSMLTACDGSTVVDRVYVNSPGARVQARASLVPCKLHMHLFARIPLAS